MALAALDPSAPGILIRMAAPGGGGSLASSASQEGGRKPLSVCFQNVHLSCLHC